MIFRIRLSEIEPGLPRVRALHYKPSMGNPRLRIAIVASAVITAACLTYGLTSEDGLFAAAVVNLVLVAGIGYGYIRWAAPKKGSRLRDLEGLAASIGLVFDPAELRPQDAPFGFLPLFDRGDPKVLGNRLAGPWPTDGAGDRHEVQVFDYLYRPRGAADTARIGRSVAIWHLPGAALPRLSMRPEGALLGRLAPGEDPGIRFDGDDTFSKRFRLKGPDPDAIQALFHAGVRRFFATHSRAWCVEAEGEWLVVCVDDAVEGRLRAPEIRGFLDEAAGIRRFFAA